MDVLIKCAVCGKFFRVEDGHVSTMLAPDIIICEECYDKEREELFEIEEDLL